MDQDGAPVPGVMLNFCTDAACIPRKSDANGTVSFDGAPDVYHVQLIKAPEGDLTYDGTEKAATITGDTAGWFVSVCETAIICGSAVAVILIGNI